MSEHRLQDFARGPRQKQIAELRDAGQTIRGIAKQLGLVNGSVSGTLTTLKRYAASRGFSPEHDMTRPCPDTHIVKGTSTLYDDDGNMRLQWVKTTADQDRLRLFAEQLAEGIVQTVKPAKATPPPKQTQNPAQLAVYPVGDAHIGLYCWEEDAEEDNDVRMAQALMCRGFDQVIRSTPAAKQALIINLGDWFHTDTTENMTRASGHHLDVDTRWSKVIRVGILIMKYLINAALAKHDTVRVINSIGNHDDQTAIMLTQVITAFYANEPRLIVDESPDAFHWHEFGNNLIGVHHGHRCKPADLYRVMSEDQRAACGRCRHRYWYIGHVHHSRKIDEGGQVIESFRTLTPRDTYAHSHGYRAPRDICSIILDRDHGECFRTTVNVQALRSNPPAKKTTKRKAA